MEFENSQLQSYLTDKFASFLSEERKQTIDYVLNNRTNYVRLVVEDLIDPHNINAIFRSGECLGIQHFHIIDNDQHFYIGKGVSKGASKWIDIHRHDQEHENNSLIAIQALKAKGYQILVTSPAKEAVSLETVDISTPFALVMGSESHGVSQTMKAYADQTIKIPMYGFTESFNVSVAAAILSHQLVNRVKAEVTNWQLEESVKAAYKFEWYKKCMARPDYYQKYFVKAFELDQTK